MSSVPFLRVAFQGERGAFSEDAVQRLFPAGAELVTCKSFEALFAAVTEGDAAYAVAPLENTLAGSVTRCYDLLLANDLHMVGETVVPIRHCLIGCYAATLQSIRTVASHPVALAQCERFFKTNPQIRAIAADDTAGSVRSVMENADPMLAAIASANAAHIYGAKILARNLEDHAENYTRFALLSPQPLEAQLGDSDKLSVVFSLTNRAGAFHDVLGPFARAGIDLVKIESRPIAGKPWCYHFFLDLVSADNPRLNSALKELQESKCVEELKVLGFYRSAKNLGLHSEKELAS